MDLGKKEALKHNLDVYYPSKILCTDNAAMIAMAAHFKFLEGIFADLSTAPLPNLAIQN